jgi:two-component system capsular synthesis sensor histidine kinase RcsC
MAGSTLLDTDSRGGPLSIRVAVADDHPVVLAGLEHFLSGIADLTVIGFANDSTALVELLGNRELIQQQLEALGFSVDTAEDGQIALKVWNDDYVALLTDINMPRMNGYELTQALRERGVSQPILAVTATALASEKQRCRDAGITDLLLKPLSLEQLDAAMTQYVALPIPLPASTASPGPRPIPDKVRRIFVAAGGQDLNTLLEAARTGNETVLLERLHSLKGALFVVGEHPVAQQCASIETCVEEEGLDAATPALVELERSVRGILDRYARHVES